MTILVTGAAGMLGSAVMRAAQMLRLEVVGLTRQDCDITDRIQVAEVLGRYQDPVVINCAGIVKERASTLIELYQVNALGPMILANHAARLVHVSTDCVFDGNIQEGGYDENAPPHPVDAYGEQKLAGEAIPDPRHLVVRVSFIGLGQRGLLHWLLSHPNGAQVPGFTNWIWNGWTVNALAPYLLSLAMQPDIVGLRHIPGPVMISKGELLDMVATLLAPGITVTLVEAEEPRRMVLGTGFASPAPPPYTWYEMVNDLFAQMHNQKLGRLSSS